MEQLQALIEEAIGGSREAYAAIYDALFDEIYRYLYWSVSRQEDAEDLAAEVFLRGFRAIGNLRKDAVHSKAWFYRIARNLVIDHHRRHGSRKEAPLEEAWGLDCGSDLEKLQEERYERTLVREALCELTEEQRQVLILKYFSGFTNDEVGKVLGKRPGAINALQYRGLRHMEKILKRRGWPN